MKIENIKDAVIGSIALGTTAWAVWAVLKILGII